MAQYFFEGLTTKSVSIKRKDTPESIPHRTCYVNSESGREKIMSEVPQFFLKQIFLLWGDSPTVNDKS